MPVIESRLKELGVTLLTRNTRQLALTDAGERFYRRCLRTLDEARLAIEEARSEHSQLKGTLRITTTVAKTKCCR